MADTTHGVVAVGDSLITGYGLALGGVSSQSWAWWLSYARNDCYTSHAVNGVVAAQVARDQLPMLVSHYALGLICVGANDVARFDETTFGPPLLEICSRLGEHADVVGLATLPLRMRPSRQNWRHTALRISRLNEQIRLIASNTGAVVVDLQDALTGPWSMSPDRQHPTSLGYLEAARVATVALDAVGVRFARHLPDVNNVVVSAAEQRLYAAPVRERLRGHIAALRSDRGRRR